MIPFIDRTDAGQQLSRAFDRYLGEQSVVVLAVPRGGVPVAFEIATRLGAPLDVVVVRELGVPDLPELAMGVIAQGGVRLVDRAVTSQMRISPEMFERVAESELVELERWERMYRGGRPPLDVHGKIAIVVDDGVATGTTLAAAIESVRARAPARTIAAVPVASAELCEALAMRTDEMICLTVPERIRPVSLCYRDFSEPSDTEVRQLLDAAPHPLPMGIDQRVHASSR